LEAIRGLASKLPEHAACLAAILALVDDLGALAISAEPDPCTIRAIIDQAEELRGGASAPADAARAAADRFLAEGRRSIAARIGARFQ
jgi:hypothetical protein